MVVGYPGLPPVLGYPGLTVELFKLAFVVPFTVVVLVVLTLAEGFELLAPGVTVVEPAVLAFGLPELKSGAAPLKLAVAEPEPELRSGVAPLKLAVDDLALLELRSGAAPLKLAVAAFELALVPAAEADEFLVGVALAAPAPPTAVPPAAAAAPAGRVPSANAEIVVRIKM